MLRFITNLIRHQLTRCYLFKCCGACLSMTTPDYRTPK